MVRAAEDWKDINQNVQIFSPLSYKTKQKNWNSEAGLN